MWGKEINTTAYLLHDKDFEKELEQTFLKNREAEVGASASHRPSSISIPIGNAS
jgi:hypothetical protein